MDTTKGTTLSLGFSFGIRPDGRPGSCNEKLSVDMGKVEEMMTRDETQRLSGEQWELADAAEDGDHLRPETRYVCKPPLLSADDIRRPASIRCRIDTPEFPAEALLRSKLENPSLDREAGIAAAFEPLLCNRTLFRDFRNVVEFHDLVRADKGTLGIEKRLIPQEGEPLRRYQSIRVNRFILESIFDESMLRPSAYLNTGGVVEDILKQIQTVRPSSAIVTILVLCHPSHLFWCGYNVARQVSGFPNKILFAEALLERCREIVASFPASNRRHPDARAEAAGLLRRESPVRWGEIELGEEYDTDAEEWWDGQSAQVWTRSKPNYIKYNDLK